MITAGQHTFPCSRETLWPLLLDPAVIAMTMPGTRSMVREAPARYVGTLRVGLGAFVSAEFDLTVTLTDVREPERYTMHLDGRGRLGYTRGEVHVRLAAEAGRTVMDYEGELQVGGSIAVVGQRLLDTVARRLTKQGLEAMEREVKKRLGVRG